MTSSSKRPTRPGPRTPIGRISTELRQTRPFASLEREAAVTLLRTADVLRHALESALRAWDVSIEQYNVLRILRGSGEGLPTLEIAERMVSRSPNITRLVDKMVAKGLAERRATEHDRRVVCIVATGRGRSALAELDTAVDSVLGKLSSMEPRRLKTLVPLLDDVRERLAVPTAREGVSRKQKG